METFDRTMSEDTFYKGKWYIEIGVGRNKTKTQAVLKGINFGQAISDYSIGMMTLFQLSFPLNEANLRKYNIIRLITLLWYEPQASNIQPWSKITTRSTDAIIFNMNLNEPKPSWADPSEASFMFVSYTNRNISGSCWLKSNPETRLLIHTILSVISLGCAHCTSINCNS
jgi:hypothetical protein